MRKLDNRNISISIQKINRNKRGYAQQIDFSKVTEDIIILSHQPGLGKTYTVLEFMKNHPDTIYLTNRHDIIRENVKHWKQGSYAHWVGFNKICKNKTLKRLNESYGINPSILCKSCTNKKCKYRWQFTQRQRVFAPYDYLSRGHILNNLPEYIFLDEQKLTVDTLTFDYSSTLNWLSIIEKHSTMPNSYVTNMQNKNYQYFINTGFNDIQTLYYNDAQKNAYSAKNMNDLKIITDINPYLLEKYFIMADGYNDFTRPSYYFPLCYNAFNVLNRAQKPIKVVFMDASFNYKLFRYFLETFNGEIGFNNPMTVRIFYSDVKNKDTTVHSMRLSDKYQSWLPKISFWAPNGSLNIKSMLNWLPYHINRIREIYGEENVGIISYKRIAKNPFFRLLGVDIQHFGGLRSSNSFRDKQVIIVIGTFFGSKNQVADNLEKLFDIQNTGIIIEELDSDKEIAKLMEDVGIDTKKTSLSDYDKILKPKKRRRYTDNQNPIYDKDWYLEGYTPPTNLQAKDFEDMIKHRIYPVDWIQKAIWDEEMYQAFHRNRGLLNKRVIFAYCWFPPEIINEFDIETVKRYKPDEEKFWKKLETQEEKNRLMRLFIKDIDKLIEEKSITIQDIQTAIKNPKSKRIGGITTIAKRYKMYNKSDRDSMKKLLLHYLEIKGLVK